MVRWAISLRVKAEGHVGGDFLLILRLLSCENFGHELSNGAVSCRCDMLTYIIHVGGAIASRKEIVKGGGGRVVVVVSPTS